MGNFHEIFWRHWRFGVAFFVGGAIGRFVYYFGERFYFNYKQQQMNDIDVLSVSIFLFSCLVGILLIVTIYKWLTKYSSE